MYTCLPFPYDYWSKQLTPAAARRALSALMEELPVRVRTLQAYLEEVLAESVNVDASDQAVDKLPDLIAKVSGARELTEEEVADRLEGVRDEDKWKVMAMMPKKQLDEETLRLVFDGGLLLGEIFRYRYPSAVWGICRTPVSDIDYGRPIIINPEVKREQFGPVREVTGAVGQRLITSPRPEWPMSKILKMRACQLQYGPDPRL